MNTKILFRSFVLYANAYLFYARSTSTRSIIIRLYTGWWFCVLFYLPRFSRTVRESLHIVCGRFEWTVLTMVFFSFLQLFRLIGFFSTFRRYSPCAHHKRIQLQYMYSFHLTSNARCLNSDSRNAEMRLVLLNGRWNIRTSDVLLRVRYR